MLKEAGRLERGGVRANREGRLSARPARAQEEGYAPLGRQTLRLEGGRDALLYVPAGYRHDRPAPLALMLHGAGGQAGHGLALLERFADGAGLILLAPASHGQTWDDHHGQLRP